MLAAPQHPAGSRHAAQRSGDAATSAPEAQTLALQRPPSTPHGDVICIVEDSADLLEGNSDDDPDWEGSVSPADRICDDGTGVGGPSASARKRSSAGEQLRKPAASPVDALGTVSMVIHATHAWYHAWVQRS